MKYRNNQRNLKSVKNEASAKVKWWNGKLKWNGSSHKSLVKFTSLKASKKRHDKILGNVKES